MLQPGVPGCSARLTRLAVVREAAGQRLAMSGGTKSQCQCVCKLFTTCVLAAWCSGACLPGMHVLHTGTWIMAAWFGMLFSCVCPSCVWGEVSLPNLTASGAPLDDRNVEAISESHPLALSCDTAPSLTLLPPALPCSIDDNLQGFHGPRTGRSDTASAAASTNHNPTPSPHADNLILDSQPDGLNVRSQHVCTESSCHTASPHEQCGLHVNFRADAGFEDAPMPWW